jgi:hypothetical protein
VFAEQRGFHHLHLPRQIANPVAARPTAINAAATKSRGNIAAARGAKISSSAGTPSMARRPAIAA